MPLSNDDRGWVMTGLSGIACIFGASFICVDIIVRQFPGKKGWRIQDSDVFLSTSLSLSFGVMIFSALFSMLPSAKSSLIKGGCSSKEACWILIGCFAGGVIGIQFISRLMHHFVPHNVVDCEHQHDAEEARKENGNDQHEHGTDQDYRIPHALSRKNSSQRLNSHRAYAGRPQMQQTQTSASYFNSHKSSLSQAATSESEDLFRPSPAGDEEAGRRATLKSRITTSVSKLTPGKNPSCEDDGPCLGYSDPCQETCFKNVAAAGGLKAPSTTNEVHRPAATKAVTATESTPLLHGITEEASTRPHTRAAAQGATETGDNHEYDHKHHHHSDGPSEDSPATVAVDGANELRKKHPHDRNSNVVEPGHHHHHVPTNAFMNIGLQTSFAIALHKLPEGFITYATNHANPELGVSVFLALFIHNITEGFAMALPLYLAINNRLKAMVISFALGGLSQPLGAAVAAVWFRVAGKSDWAPSDSGYGAMFAITAGIMASVGLQLFAEALELTHSRNLCFVGAIAGMCILGVSSALTAS